MSSDERIVPAGRGELTDDFGHWSVTAAFLRRLGAQQVYLLGLGLGATFERFALETQIYPTRGVIAVSSDKNGTKLFSLSSAVDEPRAFSVSLHRPPRLDESVAVLGDVLKITFAPVPDRRSGVDPFELARRYAVALAYLLDDPRHRSMLPPLRHVGEVEELFVRLLT